MVMNILIKDNFRVNLYGASGVAINRNWGETGRKLMDRMWGQVRSRQLKNKGINIWVYEEHEKLFTGVELEEPPPAEAVLEEKIIHLPRYAYYKHIGSYDKIGESVTAVQRELQQRGIKTRWPYLEIYGHWTEDPSRLETELLWTI